MGSWPLSAARCVCSQPAARPEAGYADPGVCRSHRTRRSGGQLSLGVRPGGMKDDTGLEFCKVPKKINIPVKIHEPIDTKLLT